MEAAVTDPETRKRFRHFVNSDLRDDNLVFLEERGQIRPATPEERNLQRSRLSHIPVVAVPAKA
jgi:nitrite reductase (NADH) large subunit